MTRDEPEAVDRPVAGADGVPRGRELATCAVCGRHRRVVGRDGRNRPVCPSCIGPVRITHRCPDCAAEVPGAGSAPCMACAARRRATRRIALNLETLEQPWVRDLFLAFCASGRVRLEKGNITALIDRYAEVFHRIDSVMRAPADLTQERLFTLFAAEGLRRAFKVVGFLCEATGMAWSGVTLERLIEERRQDALLSARAAKPWAKVLVSYRVHLLEEPGKRRGAKTVRVYLNAAARLLDAADLTDVQSLEQRHVDRFVRRWPGQAACLNAFLGWLANAYGVTLTRPRPRKSDPKVLERRLLAALPRVLDRLEATASPREARALLAVTIACLYQIPLTRVLALSSTDVCCEDDRVVLWPGQGDVRLSPDLGRTLLGQMNSTTGGLVFTGRNGHQPLSTSAVIYHLAVLDRAHDGPMRAR